MEELQLDWTVASGDTPEGAFVQNTLQRIETFQAQNERIPSFEASNYYAAAGVLKAIRNHGLTMGKRFCEWGSEFGVLSCLAAMEAYDACGIEIETKLVRSAASSE